MNVNKATGDWDMEWWSWGLLIFAMIVGGTLLYLFTRLWIRWKCDSYW